MATIRLLHASDLHISKFLNLKQLHKRQRSSVVDSLTHYTFAPVYSPRTLSRFLRFLRPRADSLDALVLTGDIATTGRTFDLEKAYSVVKTRLQPIGIDICLLPGNHDRWEPYRVGHNTALMSLGYNPGGREFHNVFGDFWWLILKR
jgi:DNA repair exonuclease SbcCD nuclease subunit